MISQNELIIKCKEFGYSITSQTLRNYIRDGLCLGVMGQPYTVSKQSVEPYYDEATLFQAMATKAIFTNAGYRVSKIEAVLGKRLAEAIQIRQYQNLDYMGYSSYMPVDIINDPHAVGQLTLNNSGELAIADDVVIFDEQEQRFIVRKNPFKYGDFFGIAFGDVDKSKPKEKRYDYRKIVELAARWLVLRFNFQDPTCLEIRSRLPWLPECYYLKPLCIEESCYVDVKLNGFYDFVDRIYSYTRRERLQIVFDGLTKQLAYGTITDAQKNELQKQLKDVKDVLQYLQHSDTEEVISI